MSGAAAGTDPGDDRDLLTAVRTLHWRAMLMLALAVALGLAAGDVVRLVARPLALLVIAIALAAALAPIVDRLAGLVRWRVLAVTLVFLALFALLALAGWLLLPPLIEQGRRLADQLPSMVAGLQQRLAGLGLPGDLGLESLAGPLTEFAVSVPSRILTVLLDFIIIVFLAIYWLLGSAQMRRFGLSLLAEPRRTRADEVTREMGAAMGGYVRAVVINAAIMGVLAWLGLTLIGVRFPVVLGVLTMMGEVVPIIGPIVVGVIVTGVALIQSASKALIALLLFTGLTQLEGNLLTPNIMRSQTHVPQTLVLLAVVVGAALGGVLGILAAIPAAAAARVFVLRVVAPAERRRQGAPEAADA